MLTLTERKIRDTLIKHAKKKSVVSYAKGISEAKVAINIMQINDRNRMSQYLLNLAAEDASAGRPPITAVMVRGADKLPGSGFFEMADLLGLRHAGEDNLTMYARLLNEVFAYDWDLI